MSQTDWPRDPSELYRTRHAKDKMKERNIGMHELKKCIREGNINVEAGNARHEAVYRLEIPGVDLLAVIDKNKGSVETVYWDNQQGATGGGLGGRYSMLQRIM
jgi:hypothetical protein